MKLFLTQLLFVGFSCLILSGFCSFSSQSAVNRQLLMFNPHQLLRLRNTRIHLIGDNTLTSEVERILEASGAENVVRNFPKNVGKSDICVVCSSCPLYVARVTDALSRGRTVGMVVSSSNGVVVTDVGSKMFINDAREPSIFLRRLYPAPNDISSIQSVGNKNKILFTFDSEAVAEMKLHQGDTLVLAGLEPIPFRIDFIEKHISLHGLQKVVVSYDSSSSKINMDELEGEIRSIGLSLAPRTEMIRHSQSVGKVIRSKLIIDTMPFRSKVACCPATLLACSAVAAQQAINMITKSHLPISNQQCNQLFSINNSGSSGKTHIVGFSSSQDRTSPLRAPRAFVSASSVYTSKSFHNWIRNCNFSVIGAGALGCEWIWMLGKLSQVKALNEKLQVRLIDFDRIEPENLGRQFIYDGKHIGRSKSIAAAEIANEKFPNMKATGIDRQLVESGGSRDFRTVTVDSLVKSSDNAKKNVFISAVDNIKTRNLLVNSIGKFDTLVDTGIHGYRGHADVYNGNAKDIDDFSKSFARFDNSKPVCSIHAIPTDFIDCLMVILEKCVICLQWSWNRLEKQEKYQLLSESEKMNQIVQYAIPRAIKYNINPFPYNDSIVAMQSLLLNVVPSLPSTSALSCGLAVCDLFRMINSGGSNTMLSNYFDMQSNSYVDY